MEPMGSENIPGVPLINCCKGGKGHNGGDLRQDGRQQRMWLLRKAGHSALYWTGRGCTQINCHSKLAVRCTVYKRQHWVLKKHMYSRHVVV